MPCSVERLEQLISNREKLLSMHEETLYAMNICLANGCLAPDGYEVHVRCPITGEYKRAADPAWHADFYRLVAKPKPVEPVTVQRPFTEEEALQACRDDTVVTRNGTKHTSVIYAFHPTSAKGSIAARVALAYGDGWWDLEYLAKEWTNGGVLVQVQSPKVKSVDDFWKLPRHERDELLANGTKVKA